MNGFLNLEMWHRIFTILQLKKRTSSSSLPPLLIHLFTLALLPVAVRIKDVRAVVLRVVGGANEFDI